MAVEADSDETLWTQHTPQQTASERGLYVRSSSGIFTYIGPQGPPSLVPEEPSNVLDPSSFNADAVKATTSNYEHIVMEAEYTGGRWSFDQTLVNEQHHSLYEYSGTGNTQPILVGVEGGKGSTNVIGLCGTELGSAAQGSAYNALSADGETIFFTLQRVGRFGCVGPAPATTEVYARRHGSLASPKAAETIDLSESECSIECGEASGKNFEGASEDGKKAFFTSTQKLTNEAVDGTASGDATRGAGCATFAPNEGGCNLYLYDFAEPSSQRLKAVSDGGKVLGVAGIAEDGSRVYYVSRTAIGSAGKDLYGQSPIEGQPNLYMYNTVREQTTFISTLATGDESDWSRIFMHPVEVAGRNGRFLLFASGAPSITPDDFTEQTQLFEYKAEEGNEAAELVRITKGEDEFNENGNGVSSGVPLETLTSVADKLGNGFDFKSQENRLNLSADGRSVFFLTSGQLSPRATSAEMGCRSLYEFHTDGALVHGDVRLISDGQDTQPNQGSICGPHFQGIDEGGDNVLFDTASPLLSHDTDGVQRDIYDARINGGFIVNEAATCVAEFCEGLPSIQPQLPAARSTTASGEESRAPTTVAGSTKQVKAVRRKKRKHDRLAQTVRACRKTGHNHRLSCRHAVRRRLHLRSAARPRSKSTKRWSR